MKASVYNSEGKVVGDVTLDKNIFEVPVKAEVIQQAVRTLQANRRKPVAHTKDRSDVRGGGRKPWRQKGTGRARHGSTRSPLWKGGGVTFGPTKDRNFSLQMNRKAKRKALFMSLSDKAQDKKIIIVDSLELSEIKTKTLATLMAKLPVEKKILTVLPKVDEKIIKSANNIPTVTTIQADSLNTEEVIRNKFIVLPKASLEVMSKTYVK